MHPSRLAPCRQLGTTTRRSHQHIWRGTSPSSHPRAGWHILARVCRVGKLGGAQAASAALVSSLARQGLGHVEGLAGTVPAAEWEALEQL